MSIGALAVGGLATLGGAYISGQAAEKSAKTAADAAIAASSGRLGAARKLADEDREFQKHFARHGIRWRVRDARRAGLHPLSVLGASAISASPTSVGMEPAQAVRGHGSETQRAVGDAIQAIGMELLATELRGKQIDNDMRILERTLTAEQLKALQIDNLYRADLTHAEWMDMRNPKGTRKNPVPLFRHYRDPVSGRIVVSTDPDFAEGGEGFVGKLGTTYGNVAEGTLDLFFEGLQ